MKAGKGFLHWFGNQSLGRKIMYTFIVTSVIPLLVVQILMLYVISNNMREKVDELMVSQLVQISERTDLTIEIYTNLVYQIYSDNEIIKEINSCQNASPEARARAYRKICGKIQQYGMSAGGVECISIVLENGEDITYDFGMASAVDNLWEMYEDKKKMKPYELAQEGASNMVISPTERIVREEEEERIFHISKQMYDFKDIRKGTIGTVIMSVNETVLNSVCSAGQEETDAYTFNFIADEEGRILTYPEPFYAGIALAEGRTVKEFVEKTGVLEGKKIAVNQYKNENLGWYFYNAYDEDYILRDVRHIQYLTIVIGILLLMLSLFLIRYTVTMIGKSTRSIMTGITEVQRGNLNVQVNVENRDEMGQIADNFNAMTGKVQGLIEEVKTVTVKQKDAEIRALEAQINPHFLYNTLDSINWMAIEKEEYEISRMVRNLGVILRYSVDKSNKMATVAEMADWLEKYVSLQRMRFNDAFMCEIHVQPETKRIRIYKLLLQPFVENAIVHGFKGIEHGGILRVDVMLSEQGKWLDIIIEDNGKGIPREIAERFNNTETVLQDKETHIGLQNAFSRMRMYYGSSASWNVSSIPEVGTVITLKIPVEERQSDENCSC
ncbi:MAG: sensor histidine kinase [Lachnospiraceae bacterium]